MIDKTPKGSKRATLLGEVRKEEERAVELGFVKDTKPKKWTPSKALTKKFGNSKAFTSAKSQLDIK